MNGPNADSRGTYGGRAARRGCLALIISVLLTLFAGGGEAMAATVGHNTIYASAGSADGRQAATKVTMTESGTITSITAYVGAASNKDIRYALYADNAGEPGALLAETAVATTTTAMQWKTITLPSTGVAAGDYWLAVCMSKAAQNYRYTSTGGAFRENGNDAIGSPAGSNSFQANWSGTTVSNASKMSIYATYTPTPVLSLSDHDAGQETDAFTESGSETNAELYAFKLTPSAGTITVTQLVFRLTGVSGLVNGDWAGVEIRDDANDDGTISGAETTTVGGTGTVNTAAGTITFTTNFNVTTATHYILRADFSSLSEGDDVTIGLANADVSTATGEYGSATNATHSEHTPVLTLSNHTASQEGDAFSDSGSETDAELYAFKLNPGGDTITVTQLVFPISSITGLTDGDWSGVEIRVDANGDGDIAIGETTTVGGAGSVNTGAGTITFSTNFNVSATTDYILRADFASLFDADSVTINLAAANITTAGIEAGSTTGVTHLEVQLLTFTDHTAGPETDAFTGSGGETNAELFAVTFDPGSSTNITQVVFRISNITGLGDGDWAGVELVEDTNDDGDIGGGETTTVGGAGAVSQAAGTITFSTSFVVSGITSFVLRADFASLSAGDSVTIGLDASDVSSPKTINGYATAVIHSEANSVADVLLVVANSASLLAQETKRKTLFEGWGYRVVPISDHATQAQFDAAAALADVAYISETVSGATVGTKLKSTTIGVVNGDARQDIMLSFSSSFSSYTDDELDITDDTHYLSRKFPTGALVITSSDQALHTAIGTMGAGATVLGERPATSDAALLYMEIGTAMYAGGNVKGRRVHLPWGLAFDMDSLNDDGTTLLKRSLKWASGPLAHWRLDDASGTTALDARGGHDGTLTGAAWDFGYLRGGLDLSGAGEYVTVSDANSLDITQALTITAWIKGDAWGTGSDADVILRKGSTDPNNYQLAIIDSKLNVSLDDSDGTGHTADTVLGTGTWYHVAVTWDGNWVRLYVNGVQDHAGAHARTGSIGTDARDLYLGGRPGGDYFDGVIDDVQLYNRALTPKEIVLAMTAEPVKVITWQEIDPGS